MLSCKELAQHHASAHIDGELQGRLRWSVRLHLMMCGHCRRFMQQLKTVRAVLRSSPGNTSGNTSGNEEQVLALGRELQQQYQKARDAKESI